MCCLAEGTWRWALTDTGSRDLSWFLNQSNSNILDQPLTTDAAELGRMSVEAMVIKQEGSARSIRSEGSLRISGDGVIGNSAPLDVVGKIALAWQKAVITIGASIEGIRSPLGKVPKEIGLRTRLNLVASPSPGSIILRVSPLQDPLTESEPNGNRTMIDAPRPLADQAVNSLIDLLNEANNSRPSDLDDFANHVQSLGPRVGSAVVQFVREIDKGNLTLEAFWREPQAAAIFTRIDASGARFIATFIEGRELDGVEETLVGTLATVSVSERWLVELEDGAVHMDASGLSSEVPAQWRVGQRVKLSVLITIREQPDGATRRKFTILNVEEES